MNSLIENDRAPHAILFSGKEGRGIFLEAFYYTLRLLCSTPENGRPCLRCKNCKRLNHWIYPDLHLTVPTYESNQITKNILSEWRIFIEGNDYFNINSWANHLGTTSKPNITKKQCDDILQTYNLKSYEGGKKIFFIWGTELLEKEGNRLLKIIEEPTDDTYFIFIAYNKNQILPTILSRLQQIDIPPASDTEIMDYCSQRELGDSNEIKEAVNLGDGSISEVINILTSKEHLFSEYLLSGLRTAYQGNGLEMMKWVENIQKLNTGQFIQFLQYQLHFFREAIAGHNQRNYIKRLLRSEQKAANWLFNNVRFLEVFRLVEQIDHYIGSMNQNANKKILATNLILDYKKLIKRS
nr:hypothetical protein [Membranihabitans maritimus]